MAGMTLIPIPENGGESGNDEYPEHVYLYDEDGGGVYGPDDFADMLNRLKGRMYFQFSDDRVVFLCDDGVWRSIRRTSGYNSSGYEVYIYA